MNSSSRDISLCLMLRGVASGHELGQLSPREVTESAAQRQPVFGIMTLVQCIGPNIGIYVRKARCIDSKC
ncbi:MAG: hypothetical protein EOS07_24280 [Mesorhizobium sp.]|nr:MAG: hypothetical protein EOS07_24280 [Mesorhizobium sp.]TIL60306.1 MAG: hypothetical protein E5Y79_10430 [Mesorhizobium sp.]TIM13374.1 MAG: hypothetical protein E5Y67_17805 [Mesorhizobium sp.]TIN46914.1 MAG: hypothetical protein E5Y32_08725 [Mesorhizobium sp.]